MRQTREVMGMPVTMHVTGAAADEDALDEAFNEFVLLDQTFSPFIAGSEVSRMNRGELRPEDASDLVGQALDLCRLYEEATHGYFSAWIGGRIDPTGLIKGWAIDRSCSILHRHGYRDYFVDAGGDVQTRGLNEDGGPWRVGIRHPVYRHKVARVILAQNLAVATSGTYEKGDHIIDPHTGRAATDLLSLTVVGPDILQADVYATAAFAMGPKGLSFIEEIEHYEAFSVTPDCIGTSTSGFDALCAR